MSNDPYNNNPFKDENHTIDFDLKNERDANRELSETVKDMFQPMKKDDKGWWV